MQSSLYAHAHMTKKVRRAKSGVLAVQVCGQDKHGKREADEERAPQVPVVQVCPCSEGQQHLQQLQQDVLDVAPLCIPPDTADVLTQRTCFLMWSVLWSLSVQQTMVAYTGSSSVMSSAAGRSTTSPNCICGDALLIASAFCSVLRGGVSHSF